MGLDESRCARPAACDLRPHLPPAARRRRHHPPPVAPPRLCVAVGQFRHELGLAQQRAHRVGGGARRARRAHAPRAEPRKTLGAQPHAAAAATAAAAALEGVAEGLEQPRWRCGLGGHRGEPRPLTPPLRLGRSPLGGGLECKQRGAHLGQLGYAERGATRRLEAAVEDREVVQKGWRLGPRRLDRLGHHSERLTALCRVRREHRLQAEVSARCRLGLGCQQE